MLSVVLCLYQNVNLVLEIDRYDSLSLEDHYLKKDRIYLKLKIKEWLKIYFLKFYVVDGSIFS